VSCAAGCKRLLTPSSRPWLVADGVRTLVISGSATGSAEEAPEALLAALTAFLGPYRGGESAARDPECMRRSIHVAASESAAWAACTERARRLLFEPQSGSAERLATDSSSKLIALARASVRAPRPSRASLEPAGTMFR
jgi:hypothetical protein